MDVIQIGIFSQIFNRYSKSFLQKTKILPNLFIVANLA